MSKRFNLQAKETEEEARRVAAEDRAKMKEERRQKRLEDEEQKKAKRQKKEEERQKREDERRRVREERDARGRLADIKYTCGVCGVRARVNDELLGIEWYGCDSDECKSSGWFHLDCLNVIESEALRESLECGAKWVCRFCLREE